MNRPAWLILILAALISSLVPSMSRAEGDAQAVAADLAERCQTCHVGGLALTRFDADTLIERIDAVRNAPGMHAPLLGDTEPATVAALAELLAAKDDE